MIWQYIYLLVIFSAVAISLGIAAFAWGHRSKSSVFMFAGMMFAVAEWLSTCGMVSLSQSPQQAITWIDPRYFGLTVMLAFFINFVLQYTGREKWLTKPLQAFIFAVPIITQLIIATNPLHHWFIQEVVFSPDGILMGLDSVRYGPLFWIHTIYSYFLVLIGIGLIIQRSVRNFHLYQSQASLMIIGVLPPLTTSVLDAFLLIPGLKHPLAPIGFAAMGMFFFTAVSRHRMLDIVPVARDLVIESMNDAMIVLDVHNNIVDVNTAAQQLLGVETFNIIGEPIGQVFPQWNSLNVEIQTQTAIQSEIMLTRFDRPTYFELNLFPLINTRRPAREHVMILRDVTQRKETEIQLQKTIRSVQALQEQLYEQTIRDPLTNLYNRRFMDETLRREFRRSAREMYPISIVIMDIDHFKVINDTFGHHAGDEVLKQVANILTTQTRESDYVFRYGGEEFLIILPQASALEAYQYAERYRCHFQENSMMYSDQKVTLTMSIGIAAYSGGKETPEVIVAAADQALYQAKANGRNCIHLHDG